MNTITQKQSTTLSGTLKQLQTTFDTMVKSVWKYKHGLELKVQSDTVEMYSLKGTPYAIVKEQGKWFSIIGQNRVGNNYDTAKDCIKDAKRIDAHKILQLAIMVCDEKQRQSKKQA